MPSHERAAAGAHYSRNSLWDRVLKCQFAEWAFMERLRSGAASGAQGRAHESAANSSILTRPVESLDPFMVEHEFRDRARDICVAHQR
jgi:hypothetical protein